MRAIEKPWGSELIWADTPHYAAKFLRINPGERLSLQVHQEKHETLFVLVGRPAIVRNGVVVDTDEPIRIWPGAIHRISNPTDEQVLIVEASTPHLDDVVRLGDDYGRAGA